MDDVFGKAPCPRSSPVRLALLAAGALVALSGLAACGGAAASREATLNEAFARIQRREARIDIERAAVSNEAIPCEDRRRAVDVLCAESEQICSIAREVADGDAFARCERASDACRAAQGETRARCEQSGAAASATPAPTPAPSGD